MSRPLLRRVAGSRVSSSSTNLIISILGALSVIVVVFECNTQRIYSVGCRGELTGRALHAPPDDQVQSVGGCVVGAGKVHGVGFHSRLLLGAGGGKLAGK